VVGALALRFVVSSVGKPKGLTVQDWNWLAALVALTVMEVVLGIDNIIFLAILTGRLPATQQGKARFLGMALALGARLLLLFGLSWLLGLTQTVFRLTDLGVPAGWLSPAANELSWRDLILLGGGLFLIAKSTYEIHHKLERGADKPSLRGPARLGWTLVQIAVLDIVFSLDSVITAVGMSRQLWVMVTAMIIAVGVMLVFAGPVSRFVGRHPSLQMLALSFLILIGVQLVAEGIEKHIERGYLYFAMAFSLVVEMLNLRQRKVAAEEAGSEPRQVPAPDSTPAAARRSL
jgi:predicted tellurium resistance membrane protein TerC